MLKVSDLSAGYGRTTILDGVSIEVEEGDVVTIIGANGAGKTTLLRAISGLVKPNGCSPASATPPVVSACLRPAMAAS